jgi:HEAT repeat protein
LFKQALASPDPFARRIAVLGLGALGDATAIPAMAKLFTDPYLDVRWAAALALANIGTEAAVQTLKQGLLMGDDGVKQACAQALGRHPELGHPVLKETIANPDLGVRRATLYGLAEVGEEWANKSIEDAQRNEQEWYVRNAANELYARIQEPPDRRPKPYLQPEAQGWLVAWAAQKGMAVPPGKGAIEVLNRALKEGDEPARIAAAEALARLNDPLAARELYAALRDPSRPLVRDAAFRALAHLSAATGQRLSAPA